MSEIVLSRLKTRISAHCNEFSQNWWFFAISPNVGGFAYFPHKCGGFLELTRMTVMRLPVPSAFPSGSVPSQGDTLLLCTGSVQSKTSQSRSSFRSKKIHVT
jgi:hypothetical protein